MTDQLLSTSSSKNFETISNLQLTMEEICIVHDHKGIEDKEKDLYVRALNGEKMSEAQTKWILEIQKRLSGDPVTCDECKAWVYGKVSKNSGKDYWKCDNKEEHKSKDIKWLRPQSKSAPSATTNLDVSKKRKFE